MKPVSTLVLLADERQARMLVNQGVGKGLRQIRHLDRADIPGEDIAYADMPGRSRAGPGGAPHQMAPSSPEDEQNRARFVAWLIAELDGNWGRGGHDRLVIAAPPKMLGALREALPQRLSAQLSGDLAKDLVHAPLADLPGHFRDIAAF